MPSTGLHGPYPLTRAEIDKRVVESIGVYVLNDNNSGSFYVHRVGRSDVDVNARLKDYVGDYERFKYGHYRTKKPAFEKECHIYHDFDPRDNVNHPDRPDGTNYSCPVTSCPH